MGQPPTAPRSSMHLFRGMGADVEHTPSIVPPTYLDAGFGSDYSTSANPNALRRQAVNFEEAMNQPKRESRRPPASAFQSAASQDCELFTPSPLL